MRFKVANYSRLEIRLDTLHIYNGYRDKVIFYLPVGPDSRGGNRHLSRSLQVRQLSVRAIEPASKLYLDPEFTLRLIVSICSFIFHIKLLTQFFA